VLGEIQRRVLRLLQMIRIVLDNIKTDPINQPGSNSTGTQVCLATQSLSKQLSCALIAPAHLLTTIILGTCKASTPAIGQSCTL